MAIAKNYDDNSGGAVRTKLAQGSYVRIPIPTTRIAQTDPDGLGVLSTSANDVQNLDGSGTSTTMTIAGGIGAAGAGGFCWIELTFWGRIFGVRTDRASSATRYPFTVVINGEPRRVGKVQNRDTNGNVASGSDHEALYLVADDLLTDGPHTARIGLTGDPAASPAVRSIKVFGGFVEASKGYQDAGPQAFVHATYDGAAVPTTRTAISVPGAAISRVTATNTNASTARTFTLYRGTNPYKKFTLAAGESGTIDFPTPVTGAGWSWAVDTGTDTLAWVHVGKVFA